MESSPLKLLLVSATLPQLGGLETMARLMVRELSRLGTVETKVVTPVPGIWEPGLSRVSVHRQPGLPQLRHLYAWSDVVFFNHFHLRQALPLLWQPRKPVVLSISGFAPAPKDASLLTKWRHALTSLLLRRANAVIACNAWCQSKLPVSSVIVPNPYDDACFTLRQPAGRREGDILFAGRLNEAKGCLELVEAFTALARGKALRLSVAGEGPLRREMEGRLRDAGISGQADFLGTLSSEELALEMNRHRIVVVPSKYEEPLGIVALEAIACGCVVVGSHGGGLGETIGAHGLTFDNGDAAGLQTALQKALALSDDERAAMLADATQHLNRYRVETVIRGYLQVIRGITSHVTH